MDQHLGYLERAADGCLGVKDCQLVLIQYHSTITITTRLLVGTQDIFVGEEAGGRKGMARESVQCQKRKSQEEQVEEWWGAGVSKGEATLIGELGTQSATEQLPPFFFLFFALCLLLLFPFVYTPEIV